MISQFPIAATNGTSNTWSQKPEITKRDRRIVAFLNAFFASVVSLVAAVLSLVGSDSDDDTTSSDTNSSVISANVANDVGVAESVYGFALAIPGFVFALMEIEPGWIWTVLEVVGLILFLASSILNWILGFGADLQGETKIYILIVGSSSILGFVATMALLWGECNFANNVREYHEALDGWEKARAGE
ncbi:hypothetical protein GGR57DRAFT_499711 [Xylariaceae sp. FL1272]|nr:hypothetical protein GGR57DRAFT_499711 [Xylariaceae sp. FL1272]